MSCPHASTTTIAWAFGELDAGTDADAHAAHVASCSDCSEALEALEVAEAAAAPLAGALRVVEAPEPALASAPSVVPPGLRVTGLRARLFGAVALVAAVGLGTMAALLDDGWDDAPVDAAVAVRVAPPPPPVPVQAPPMNLDDELDALELELDALRTDPSIL